MGKRIKLIYILSLFSALMAISVQAYWLYNQYRYEVERYADEIAADVLRVGDEEFAERRKMAIGDDTSYIIDRSSRTQSGTVGAERGDDRSRFPDKPSSEADGGTTDFESVSDPVAAFLLGFAN